MLTRRTFRTLLLFALTLSLLLLLLAPAAHHGSCITLALACLVPFLLFCAADFRRVLPCTGAAREQSAGASPDRPSRFQRPPPSTLA